MSASTRVAASDLCNWKVYSSLDDHGLTPAYLAAATYADEALGLFFEKAKAAGIWENTMFVIYGDHDRGGLARSKPIPEVGREMFDIREDRIIFMIYLPGEEESVKAHREEFASVFGGLHDLYPTVMHLLGEEVPYGVTGTHLFVPNARRDATPHPEAFGSYYDKGELHYSDGRVWAPPNDPKQMHWKGEIKAGWALIAGILCLPQSRKTRRRRTTSREAKQSRFEASLQQ